MDWCQEKICAVRYSMPAIMFLTLLSSSLKVNAQSGTLELTLEDSNQFKTLDNGAAKFKDAMKLSRKREKGMG